MKIVKVIGGLGNQMFQFALYKALQKQHQEERILLDLHCVNGAVYLYASVRRGVAPLGE